MKWSRTRERGSECGQDRAHRHLAQPQPLPQSFHRVDKPVTRHVDRCRARSATRNATKRVFAPALLASAHHVAGVTAIRGPGAPGDVPIELARYFARWGA